MRTVTTRTQRRMEKKQALLLLLMVLAVALVSFTLGVMVGRSGTAPVARDNAAGAEPAVTRHPAPEPETPPTEDTVEAESNLTFYETLPKGEKTPLGSGINLPQEKDKAQAKTEETPGPDAPAVGDGEAPPASAQAETAPNESETGAPPAASADEPSASFILQVASFRDLKGALSLQEKLHRKGYPAEVREVDLGAKGVWSRVVVGPFASREEARATLERLKREERLSPMIRKG